MERQCPEFLQSEILGDMQLRRLSENGRYNYSLFLSPPVETCLSCHNTLTMHIPPTMAKYFSLQGVVAATKVTVECRSCSIRYGLSTYSDQEGSHYYREDVSFIEVSTSTYVNTELYNWIPSLR